MSEKKRTFAAEILRLCGYYPFYLCMLHPKNEIGTLRDGRYLFEIGGKDKSFTQIAGIEDSYVFADEIEIPVGKKMPLWLLGMMY